MLRDVIAQIPGTSTASDLYIWIGLLTLLITVLMRPWKWLQHLAHARAANEAKKKDQAQVEQATYVAAMEAMLTTTNARDAQLLAENAQLRKDLAEIGQREADKLPPLTVVLLIEDYDPDAILAETVLKQHPRIIHVVRVREVAEIHGIPADVIVADLGLRDTQGVETVTAILELRQEPLIVLTNSEELGKACRIAGAIDFIPKPQLPFEKDGLADAVIHARIKYERRNEERRNQ